MKYKFSLGVFINIKFGTLAEVEEEIKVWNADFNPQFAEKKRTEVRAPLITDNWKLITDD